MAGNGNNAAFARRAQLLAQDHSVLFVMIDKLIEVREVAAAKVAALDKEVRCFVRADPTLQRFMTVPGVGPITALAFRSTIDEPDRFKRVRDVGPYLGLTPRQSRRSITSGFAPLPATLAKPGGAVSPPPTSLDKQAPMLLELFYSPRALSALCLASAAFTHRRPVSIC